MADSKPIFTYKGDEYMYYDEGEEHFDEEAECRFGETEALFFEDEEEHNFNEIGLPFDEDERECRHGKKELHHDKMKFHHHEKEFHPKHEETGVQTHTHEFEESTKLAEMGEDRHNHRVAGVTSDAIPVGRGRHVHAILSNTDFLDHHHEIGVRTGIDIRVPGTNKHIHLVSGRTTMNDGHFHEFLFTTQIDSPLV
jgi:hypothetical protein